MVTLTAWIKNRTTLASRTVQKHQARSIPWAALTVIAIITVVLPTVAYVVIGTYYPRAMGILHTLVSTVYAFTSITVVCEAVCAMRLSRSRPAPVPIESLPTCTVIVPAYLPNEAPIIVDTVLHMLEHIDVPHDRLEVIVPYNTPEPLDVEKMLARLASEDRRLVPLKVEGSKSKAENVNAALRIANGEVIAIFDADHLPEPDCFERAWAWLQNGYDMVQGRCVIQNYAVNALTQTVAVEFDTIYAVSHQGRSNISGSALFGGSNGYWRAEAIKKIAFDQTMLTEDIDSSARALLAGYHLAHDREIVSRELAPTQFVHWLYQRKRWAQGWFEVALRHQPALLKTPNLNLWQKTVWFYLLTWREMFPIFSAQIIGLIAAAYFLHHHIDWFGNWYYTATTVITLISGPILVLITLAASGKRTTRGRIAWFAGYMIVGIVVYTCIKTAIALLAQWSHVTKDREWITTPRRTGVAPGSPS
jgi:cellulose synthase/poly-beta-1,6-N-acetylglucosamine synthase-like glycosyltransferase